MEYLASIFMVKEQTKQKTTEASGSACRLFLLVSCLASSSVEQMEAIYF
jgi:hypothetical protein